MKIAYFTNDEVNKDLAMQMADEYRVSLYPSTSLHPPPDEWFDAVLYDWDSWPFPQQLLLESLASFSSCPVALHSYSLEEEEVETWHQSGVAVFLRLELEVFRILRRLARPKTRSHPRKIPRRRELALIPR